MSNIKEVVVEKSDWNNLYDRYTVCYTDGQQDSYYRDKLPKEATRFIKEDAYCSESTMERDTYRCTKKSWDQKVYRDGKRKHHKEGCMRYYMAGNKIIARSYRTSRGIRFEVGTQFKKRNPFICGCGFFATNESNLEAESRVASVVYDLEKKHRAQIEYVDVPDMEREAFIEKMGA